MGGMIGDNAVNGTVLYAGQHRRHIAAGTQRRIDPGHSPLLQDLALIERKILGAGFAGDLNALLLVLAYDVHGTASGDMADMHRRLGLLGQHGVPHDHDLFRNGRTAGNTQLT